MFSGLFDMFGPKQNAKTGKEAEVKDTKGFDEA
jgi:hypothetical protein